MEKHDLVLNIHGEVPGVVPDGSTHEEAFLPTLKNIHQSFPNLRIVLEHCSTAAAVEAVKSCGPSVGGGNLFPPPRLDKYTNEVCNSDHYSAPPVPDGRYQ